jgi:hypothetical protein
MLNRVHYQRVSETDLPSLIQKLIDRDDKRRQQVEMLQAQIAELRERIECLERRRKKPTKSQRKSTAITSTPALRVVQK